MYTAVPPAMLKSVLRRHRCKSTTTATAASWGAKSAAAAKPARAGNTCCGALLGGALWLAVRTFAADAWAARFDRIFIVTRAGRLFNGKNHIFPQKTDPIAKPHSPSRRKARGGAEPSASRKIAGVGTPRFS